MTKLSLNIMILLLLLPIGAGAQRTMSLDEAIAMLKAESTPPDLRG